MIIAIEEKNNLSERVCRFDDWSYDLGLPRHVHDVGDDNNNQYCLERLVIPRIIPVYDWNQQEEGIINDVKYYKEVHERDIIVKDRIHNCAFRPQRLRQRIETSKYNDH